MAEAKGSSSTAGKGFGRALKIGIAIIVTILTISLVETIRDSHKASVIEANASLSAAIALNPPSGTWELTNLTDSKVRPEFIDIRFDGQGMVSDSYPIQNGSQSHVHTEGRRSAETLHYIEHISVTHSNGDVIQGINEYWFKKDDNIWTGIGTLFNTEGDRDSISWKYKG